MVNKHDITDTTLPSWTKDGSVTTFSAKTDSTLSKTVTKDEAASFAARVNIWTDDITLEVDQETDYTTDSLKFTCSNSSDLSITFSMSGIDRGCVPSWVGIDESTGQLSMTTPAVSENTTYTFNIDTNIGRTAVYTNQVSILVYCTGDACVSNTCTGGDSDDEDSDSDSKTTTIVLATVIPIATVGILVVAGVLIWYFWKKKGSSGALNAGDSLPKINAEHEPQTVARLNENEQDKA